MAMETYGYPRVHGHESCCVLGGVRALATGSGVGISHSLSRDTRSAIQAKETSWHRNASQYFGANDPTAFDPDFRYSNDIRIATVTVSREHRLLTQYPSLQQT